MQEGDMTPSSTEVCSEEKFMEVVHKHIEKVLPVEGYRNRGNTCYVNSVLQCLLKGTPLGAGIVSSDIGRHDCKKERCLLCLLGKVYEVGDRSMGQMITSILLTIKGITQYRQEDAHEFYRSLVDNIHESYVREHITQHAVKKVPGLEQTSFPYRLLSVWMQQKTACTTCKNISTVYQPFIDLSISLTDISSLEQGLHALTKPEEFPGYMCDSCGAAQKATKQSLIHRAPSVLVVQLQRFQFKSQFSSKISKRITYPLTLDISHFMAASCDSTQYTLTALLIHVGDTVNFGHYVSAVAHNGQWYLYNDSVVKPIPGDRALELCPYLLFYTRSDLLQEARTVDDISAITEKHRRQIAASVAHDHEKARRTHQNEELRRLELRKAEYQKRGERERQLHNLKKPLQTKKRSTAQINHLWKTAPPPLVTDIQRVPPIEMKPKVQTSTCEKAKRRSSMKDVMFKKQKTEMCDEDPPESPTTTENHTFLFDFNGRQSPPIPKIISTLEEHGFVASIVEADSADLPMYLGIFTSYPPECRNRALMLRRIFEGWKMKVTIAQQSMLQLFSKNMAKEGKRNDDSNRRAGRSWLTYSPNSRKVQLPDLGSEKDLLGNLNLFCGPEEEYTPTSPPKQHKPEVPMGAQDLSRLDRDLELLGQSPERNKTTPTTEEGTPDSLLNLQSTYDASQPELKGIQVENLNGVKTGPEDKIDILRADSSEPPRSPSPPRDEFSRRLKKVIQLATSQLDQSKKPISDILNHLSTSGFRWFINNTDSNIRKQGEMLSEQISTIPSETFSLTRPTIVRDLVKLVCLCAKTDDNSFLFQCDTRQNGLL
eukprot:TRINITY_DN4993_c0_g1_i3.p1 TRINITY_DN4993_c0_g1~~TRINITY_DN4993_c0_g1_i3.p1  ORF type:complete len:825 (+),score=145.82 TRINITY_DN4993_c0_g1_i3:1813-4287(+)